MPATGQSLVNRALRLLGVIGAGEDPTSDESDDALEGINAMLDAWRNERLMCYALREESLTLVAGDADYTIGPAGNLNTVRPVSIEAAWTVDANGMTHDMRMISDQDYARISVKTTQADFPELALFRGSVDTATLMVYPVPNGKVTAAKILTRVPLTALTLVGTVTLPPGWEKAIAANGALEIAAEFERTPSDEVVKMARESLAGIKTINNKRPLRARLGLPVARSSFNVYNGE